jgi:hypothetical protein
MGTTTGQSIHHVAPAGHVGSLDFPVFKKSIYVPYEPHVVKALYLIAASPAPVAIALYAATSASSAAFARPMSLSASGLRSL